MTRTRALVVEDDPNIVDLIRSNLLARGYDVVVSNTGRDVLQAIKDTFPDIILLDLMLPGVDGFDVCREVRQTSDVAIIVISARSSESDKVRALNLGADDYLTKPFGVDELLARISAALRRSRPSEATEIEEELRFGIAHIDLDGRAVYLDNELVQVTPTEYDLLLMLARNEGRVLTYERLLREVWGHGYETSRDYVRVYVGRLRRKLEHPLGFAILTESRVGYRLVTSPKQSL